VTGETRRRIAERLWILLFIVIGFLFAVLAPPIAGIPLAAAAGGLGVLDAFVHRRLVGAPWLVAAVVFGMMWLALTVAAAVAGASNGLGVFGP
jgi:hypothetical protein